MNKLSGGRSTGIDLLRLICAFLVVCIHSNYSGKNYIMPLARNAVPVFFMISGYYYSSVEKRGGQLKQIIKTLKLIAVSTTIYMIWDFCLTFYILTPPVTGIPFPVFVLARLRYIFFESSMIWPNFLVFNVPPFGEHLWYINAFLYVLLLVWLISRFMDRRKLYFLIPVFLAAFIFLDTYSNIFFGWRISDYYRRNFLVMGLPFFLLGDFLQSWKKRSALSTGTILCVFIVSFAAVISEAVFCWKTDPSIEHELYIGTAFSAAALLLLAERNLGIYENKLIQSLAGLGRKYSQGIYVLHLFFVNSLAVSARVLASRFPGFPVQSILSSPICVMLLSMLTLLLWDKAKNLFLSSGKLLKS